VSTIKAVLCRAKTRQVRAKTQQDWAQRQSKVWRRIEKESSDAKQQKAAELIRLGLLRIDEMVTKPVIHDFHVQVAHILNRFVPPNTSKATASESETQEPKSK
jgi:hypothetical protein